MKLPLNQSAGKNEPDPEPAPWAWHYKRLLELREELAESREGCLTEASATMECLGEDDASHATDDLDRDMRLARLTHLEDSLYEVDEALRRILDGTYGICEETGGVISAERLRAVPWTRYSKEAGERLEREGLLKPVRMASFTSIRGTA